MRPNLKLALGFAVVLGACGRAREPAPSNTIVVGGDVEHATVHAFARQKGREPTREELLNLHRVWIDNEVLYREGLKRRPGEHDPAKRERVIFEALGAIDRSVRIADVSDVELRRWFESHRAKYEQVAKVDFEDAAPAGENSEAAARALVETLERGGPEAARAGSRAFKGRPLTSLAQSYGKEAADALVAASPGKWQALRAREGWRAMRLLAMTPGRAADFEAQREEVRKDVLEATASERRRAAVHALWKNYRIEFEEKHDCLADKQ